MNKGIFAAGLLVLLICQLVTNTMAEAEKAEDFENPAHDVVKRSGYYGGHKWTGGYYGKRYNTGYRYYKPRYRYYPQMKYYWKHGKGY